MTMNRIINNADLVVEDMLKGWLVAHADTVVATDNSRVVKRARAPEAGKVGVVTGGGSGHEPAFLGYVGDGMVDALRRGGYTVDWLTTGLPVADCLRHDEFAALILDLNLPDIDGISVLKQLRRNGHALPVLILTARDALDERVAGLDRGADDYMVKPFALAELLARVRALLRRDQKLASNQIISGDLMLDLQQKTVTLAGTPVVLTRREFALLRRLVMQAGKLVSRMSSDTQFLFISHNKITMEMAEQLIGVTMQEQGVSRIVAVDMESALSMAEL